ncbi:MAG TPA: ATP-binding cassette domain-containing protein [Solirubrobacteraceae bacterium]|nr:ATP-binding cassette domain-containing protein [Solirubrobacteraceae bacterium]
MTVALTAADLRYAVAERTILSGISVEVRSGRVLAVRGPSGSGKSSLLAILGGLIAPSSGTVTLDGEHVGPDSELALRRRFALVLQGYGLVAALTAHENVAVVLQAAGVPRAEVTARVEAVLEQVGLGTVAEHLIEDLSGGQQQRVAVARALVTAADVFLADEPTAQLDAENRELIVSLLIERARAGAAVVIASHDPEVVDACDDLLDL